MATALGTRPRAGFIRVSKTHDVHKLVGTFDTLPEAEEAYDALEYGAFDD
jgi:hypothetical protein